MATDFYNVLGVERTATADEVKRAYRRLAHKHHPDKAGGDEEKFKQINEAYQVLSDPKKRSNYDQFGNADMGGSSGGSGPFSGFGGQGFDINFNDLGGFSDIFEQMFNGGNGGRRRRPRGEDITVDTEINFYESATGVTKDIKHRTYITCDVCHGEGAKPGTSKVACTTCSGSGTVRQSQRTVFGVFAQTTTCPTCHGEGKYPKEPCPDCRGEGRRMETRTLSVPIPAGIADEQIIRISGKGQAAPQGGTAGDLYVQVHVKPHAILKRRGNDVHVTEHVSFVDAILGTTNTVETLQGKQKITIPAGTQPGATIRLPGAGFPDVEGRGQGDQVITVNIDIPKKVSSEQRQLLEQYKKAKRKKGLFF